MSALITAAKRAPCVCVCVFGPGLWSLSSRETGAAPRQRPIISILPVSSFHLPSDLPLNSGAAAASRLTPAPEKTAGRCSVRVCVTILVKATCLRLHQEALSVLIIRVTPHGAVHPPKKTPAKAKPQSHSCR